MCPRAAVPGQCEKPTVTDVCLESMTVNWDEPKYDGGSSITGYFIEKKETTSKRWTRVSREPIRALPLGNNWDVSGLLEGAIYQFRVIAMNAAGCGLPSVPSDPVLCRDPISKSAQLMAMMSGSLLTVNVLDVWVMILLNGVHDKAAGWLDEVPVLYETRILCSMR